MVEIQFAQTHSVFCLAQFSALPYCCFFFHCDAQTAPQSIENLVTLHGILVVCLCYSAHTNNSNITQQQQQRQEYQQDKKISLLNCGKVHSTWGEKPFFQFLCEKINRCLN